MFRYAADGTFTVLHAYRTEGTYPECSLMHDRAGELYGTAENGVAHDAGTVFSVTKK